MSPHDSFDDNNAPDENDITGGMDQFNDYKKIGVEDSVNDISLLSKRLIDSTCDFYLNNSEMFTDRDSEYISAIKNAEENNLKVLLKQVKYVEHILDNLMRQLDNGGYMDNSIYTTIQEMQKSSMEITMQVSKYTRSLPDYFKYVKDDLVQVKENEKLDSSENEKDDIKEIKGDVSNENEEADKDGDNFDRPFRGVKALLMELDEEEDSLDKAIENSESEKPKPIVMDEHGERVDLNYESPEQEDGDSENDKK